MPVYDTFGVIKGTEKPNEYVLLSAHFDSWDGSQGATDNGTGTITMMEAMRILKLAYPHPKRTIMVGHWPGEEQGLNGSHAFAYDHPEIVRAIQARLQPGQRHRAHSEHVGRRAAERGRAHGALARQAAAGVSGPDSLQRRRRPGDGGTDNASFDCYGAPVFGLSSLNWDYGTYTHHTNRDSFDKIVFDDLKGNATITAMLAYLASEDPTFITRDRADLTAERGGGRGAGGGWPRRRERRTRGAERGALAAAAAAWRGAGGTNNDAKGWALTCPKTPRFTNDTSRVTAASGRP